MIEWIVSSCVLILVVIALRYVLRGRIGLRLQYALWGLVLIRLLVPVQLGTSSVSLMNAVERIPVVQAAETVSGVEGIEYSPSEATPGYGTVQGYREPVFMPDAPDFSVENKTEAEFQRMKAVIGLREILKPLWILGAVVLLTALVASNVGFGSGLAGTRRRIAADYTQLPVYVSNAVETPCLFGFFRPAIYVTPEAAADAARLRHCVEHETTHYRHGDHIWAFLRGVCLALHWYNPLVWWAVFLSRRDAELACDEATIGRIGEAQRADYGRTLIEMTCRRRTAILTATTTMTGGKKGIKERVFLIAKKPRTAVCTLVAVVLIAALAVGCTFTGAKDADSFSEWLAGAGELSYAQASKGYGQEQVSHVLTEEDRERLLEILHGIPEDAVTLRDAPGEEASALYTADADDSEYIFHVTDGGSIYMSFDSATARRLGAEEGCFWIEHASLAEFITGLVEEKGLGAEEMSGSGAGPDIPPTTGTEPDGIEVTLYLPNDNADGFVKKQVRIETGEQSIIDALIEHGALREGVRVNSFSFEPAASSTVHGAPALRLDLNDVFLKAVTTTGTAGEAMYFGSVVNTFLEAYGAYEIWITCGGKTIETGHNVYDFPFTASSDAQGDLISYGDLDGDGADERISVRQLNEWEYELIVSDGPDSVLWSAQLGTSHAGWDSYYLCELNMKEYILQYNPYMNMGLGGYYYKLISLETPGGAVVKQNSVYFEAMEVYKDPAELLSFVDEINGLLTNSVLLVSTQGGVLELGPLEILKYNGHLAQLTNFLSGAELYEFSQMLASTVTDGYGITKNTCAGCFFTSYYKDVRELNFTELLRYFPASGWVYNDIDDPEYRALSEHEGWPYGEDQTLSGELPTPIRRISVSDINEALGEYAGISLDELVYAKTSDVIYLPEYDAYYNFTSDFGAGTFYPAYGVRDGDIVRLYEQSHAAGTYGDVLTLRQAGDRYLIVSHTQGS